MKQHVPKRFGRFDVPIVNNNKSDNTYDRIYGARSNQPMITENKKIGTGYNPADDLPKFGKKTLMEEQEVSSVSYTFYYSLQIMRQIMEQQQAKDQKEEQDRNFRCLDTTQRVDFTQKTHYDNTVGRRVMKDQNGNGVSMSCKDE
jgi:hypothetical protein